MHAKHTLYQLSYIPKIKLRAMRFELIQSAWKAENLPLIYTRLTILTYKHQKNR